MDYLFTHVRKGTFRAELLGEDAEFYRVRIPTGPGSGQEHLANARVRVKGRKQAPAYEDKLLRKSLVTEVRPHGQH